jgi:hypothetical protein
MQDSMQAVAAREWDAWRKSARAALVSGSAASVASAATLALGGVVEGNDPVTPMNGPSQWVWGRRAAHARDRGIRHTVLGYAIHHAMSVMWATVFERLRRVRPGATSTMAAAVATSALAYVVDYKVVPQRLQPGFDAQVPRATLGAFYVAFAAALAAAAWSRRST